VSRGSLVFFGLIHLATPQPFTGHRLAFTFTAPEHLMVAMKWIRDHEDGENARVRAIRAGR
jgi:hypothetical protein